MPVNPGYNIQNLQSKKRIIITNICLACFDLHCVPELIINNSISNEILIFRYYIIHGLRGVNV